MTLSDEIYLLVAVQLVDEIGDWPGVDNLLGIGVLAPAMIWAYRLTSKSNDRAAAQAWRVVDELRTENERLRARLDEDHTRYRAGTPPGDIDG